MNLEPAIVILTGAGISAESGIGTFRDSGGLWENHRVEEVATPEGFARNPDLVQRFYNERRRKLFSPDIQPNAAHSALAKLEQEFQGRVMVITQNIDNLHEEAGTQNLIHMHGELLKGLCSLCKYRFDLEADLDKQMVCTNCNRAGGLRPDVVWFGEMPYGMDTCLDAVEHASLFVSIGTSGSVEPASTFVSIARRSGAWTIEVNREPSLVQYNFDDHRYGMAGSLVPELVRQILSEGLESLNPQETG